MFSEKTGPSLSLNVVSLTTFRKLKKNFLNSSKLTKPYNLAVYLVTKEITVIKSKLVITTRKRGIRFLFTEIVAKPLKTV